MYLAHVEVQNYRCLESVRVDLQPGLNVLVGRNNVGKTSLLSAIRHAMGAAPSRSESLWLSEDDFYRVGPGAPRATEMTVALTFRGLSAQERAFFYEIIDFDHADIDNSPAVVRFHASWNEKKRRAVVRRSGGPVGSNAPDVPSEILSALSVTFLPAMRDAEEHLAPGPRSRLAQMLRDIARRGKDERKEPIEEIFREANKQLEAEPLITEVQESLRNTTGRLSGTDYSEPAIRAAGINFDRILRSLQVLVPGAPVDGLHANGLGFNNLLYMAVVLEHLRLQVDDECPILMVEEPEAHLHPQLTALLARHLSSTNPAGHAPQTIVSTHSPTLVAAVPVDRVVLFFTDPETNQLRANSFMHAGLDARETRAVSRMMDVTRASMYFAKGLILVEGICETLLVPALAERLGIDLAKDHVAVVPVCGVAFETFKKLLGPRAFGIRTAIVTDADPSVEGGDKWQDMRPKKDGDSYELSERTKKLLASFDAHPTVRVHHSRVTLEFDLAEAGDENAVFMQTAWARGFDGSPRTLTAAMVTTPGLSLDEKALAVWRGVCLANSTGSKAELAQHLSEMLHEPGGCPGFVVPPYLAAAIRHVADDVSLPPTAAAPLVHADTNA